MYVLFVEVLLQLVKVLKENTKSQKISNKSSEVYILEQAFCENS